MELNEAPYVRIAPYLPGQRPSLPSTHARRHSLSGGTRLQMGAATSVWQVEHSLSAPTRL